MVWLVIIWVNISCNFFNLSNKLSPIDSKQTASKYSDWFIFSKFKLFVIFIFKVNLSCEFIEEFTTNLYYYFFDYINKMQLSSLIIIILYSL